MRALSSLAYAAAAGALWSWVALAVTSLVLPDYLALGVGTTDGGWYTAMMRSALLPVATARALTMGLVGAPSAARGGITSLAAAVAAAVGCGVGVALQVVTFMPGARRLLVVGGVGLALVAVVSSFGLSMQLHELVLAESEFVAADRFMCSDPQHPDDMTVAAAARFATVYPQSRWAPEALRVLALGAAAHGRYKDAAELWLRFARSFAKPGLPGQAYGEYCAALCEEQWGDALSARHHYTRAVSVIRQRGGDLQGWIAADAALRIARIDASRAMGASSRYWITKAGVFEGLYGPND